MVVVGAICLSPLSLLYLSLPPPLSQKKRKEKREEKKKGKGGVVVGVEFSWLQTSYLGLARCYLVSHETK